MISYRSVELFRWFALRAETLHLERHVLFSLRVECGVDDEAVDEYPQVILDLERFDVDTRFVFLLQVLLELFGDHLRDVLNVTASFSRSDRVDERDLLESFIGRSDSDFPSVTDRLEDGFHLITFIIVSSL